MKDRYRIITPENVAFEYELAGFFSRFLAWLLDLLVLLLGTIVLSFALSAAAPALGGFSTTLGTICFFILNWGYYVFMEWYFGGQSLGKRAVGLRVLSDDGVRITLLQSAVRNLFRIVDNLPLLYLVGGGVAFFSQHGKRLGDMAAGTVVVQERARPLPSNFLPEDARIPALLSDREATRRVEARLSLQERELLLKMALRRDKLPLERRLLLFQRLADHLEARLGLPRPPHTSHEVYCLNLVTLVLGGDDRRAGARARSR